jgi:hypothetical protein
MLSPTLIPVAPGTDVSDAIIAKNQFIDEFVGAKVISPDLHRDGNSPGHQNFSPTNKDGLKKFDFFVALVLRGGWSAFGEYFGRGIPRRDQAVPTA